MAISGTGPLGLRETHWRGASPGLRPNAAKTRVTDALPKTGRPLKNIIYGLDDLGV